MVLRVCLDRAPHPPGAMTGTPDTPAPGNAPPLRVLVADDQTTVREGLVTTPL